MTTSNLTQIDSPSLLILKEKVESNIDKMIAIAGGETSRLMPHIKTNKMENVVRIMIDKGIKKFKAARFVAALCYKSSRTFRGINAVIGQDLV